MKTLKKALGTGHWALGKGKDQSARWSCIMLGFVLALATNAGVLADDRTTQSPTEPSQAADAPRTLPAGWDADAAAKPDAFASYALAPDAAFVPLQWPQRVKPDGHATPWFHAVQVWEADGPFAAPGQLFASEFDGPELEMIAKRDAERLGRALGIAEADLATKLPHVIPQGEGAFCVTISAPRKDAKLRPQERRDASLAIRLVSATEDTADLHPVVSEDAIGIDPGPVRPAWLIEHTAFFVYDPIVSKADASNKPAAPRGVIVLMPGLLATPEGVLDGLARKLRRNNWVVLRMIAHPSRFIEQTPMKVDASDVDASVKAIAHVLDRRMVDCAYAVAGASAELERRRPELAALPRIAVGFSGGAIVLPTVVALEPERYAGGVLVGGGANFFQMIDTSNYTSFLGGTGPTWPEIDGTFTQENLSATKQQAYAAYLKHAMFDGFNTAQFLRDKPTLMIYGASDKAVPAPLGDQLWVRLGKKEREVYDLGHELLFAQLSGRFDAIATWCNAVVDAQAKPAPKASP